MKIYSFIFPLHEFWCLKNPIIILSPCWALLKHTEIWFYVLLFDLLQLSKIRLFWKTPLDSCISAIVKEWFVCHTVTYDLRRPPLDLRFTIHAWPDDDSASGCQWRVFIKEIKRSEEEAYRISWCCRVGDVFWVRHMQEANCHPGNQVLPTGE